MNRSHPTTNVRTAEARDDDDAQSFIRSWPFWLPVALLSLALALFFLDPFLGDWDALDYTVLALQGRPSSMILGRALFIYALHTLWLAAHAVFNLQPEQAYLLFKYFVVSQSPVAVVVWWALARELTGSVWAASLAALLLALSPFFIIYSGQVMTEVPSLVLLGAALLIHLRGVRSGNFWMVIAGTALLGLSVNVREGTALYGAWLIIAPFACGRPFNRRLILTTVLACLIFFVFAFGGFAFFYLWDVDGYRRAWLGWVESTRMESARHPVSLSNMRTLLWYFFLAGPIVLLAFPFAAWREWREKGWRSPLLLFAALGFLANLSLVVHYSVVINGRYLLTGLPAMTPLVGSFFMRAQAALGRNVARAFATVVIATILAAILFGKYFWPGNYAYALHRAEARTYRERLMLLPEDAVVIAGGQTVAVTYWRGVGSGRWDVIGTGGGWPGAQLPFTIEKYLKDGRRVFVDVDPRLWTPCGWQLEEIRELARLESRFRFRRVSDTIYEIRPLEDKGATDSPHLEKLLPEWRPEDTKYCSG